MQMEGAVQQTIFLLAFWIFLIRIEFLIWKVHWVWEKSVGIDPLDIITCKTYI